MSDAPRAGWASLLNAKTRFDFYAICLVNICTCSPQEGRFRALQTCKIRIVIAQVVFSSRFYDFG